MTALITRVSLIALAAGALTACIDARSQYAPYEGYQTPPPATPTKPNYPATEAQPAPAASAPSDNDQSPPPRATPVEPVPSEALPPVNRRPDSDSNAPPPPPPPASTPAYTPYSSLMATGPAAKPRGVKPPEPTYILSVKGSVRPAKKKIRTINIDKGDTVNSLADRFLAPKAQLIKLNKLKKPYELEVGQSLKVPTPKAYQVVSGDTLYAVSHRFNVSADVLAELNDLDPRGRLRSGEEVVLPVGMRDSGPTKRAVALASRLRPEGEYRAAEPAPGPYVAPPVRGETPPPPSAPLAAEASPNPTAVQVAAAGRGVFIWPVEGEILTSFGPMAGGQQSDGLDIAAPLGAVVKAAAAGDVVYAGDQVPGFGNLVLIKHPDGWVTAYAHLSKTTVKIKDHVEQGDEVGEIGQTGGVDKPQLHFEIRYAATAKDKAKPVDPTLVLPRGQ